MLHRRIFFIAVVSMVLSTTQAPDCMDHRLNYRLMFGKGDPECEHHSRGWTRYGSDNLCGKDCIANPKCTMWTVVNPQHSPGQYCCLHTNQDQPVTAVHMKEYNYGHWISGTQSDCVNGCPASELKLEHVQNAQDCHNTIVGETCELQCSYFSKMLAKCDWTSEAEAKRNFTQFTKWSVDVDNPCTLDVSKIIQTILVALGVTIVISALGFYIWKKHYVPYMAAKEPNVVREEIPNHLRFRPHEPVKKCNLEPIELDDLSAKTTVV
eukprot:262806_1